MFFKYYMISTNGKLSILLLVLACQGLSTSSKEFPHQESASFLFFLLPCQKFGAFLQL